MPSSALWLGLPDRVSTINNILVLSFQHHRGQNYIKFICVFFIWNSNLTGDPLFLFAYSGNARHDIPWLMIIAQVQSS